MYSSAQFAAQSRSDLAQAQAIARASASGDALGTAMFLAQQAMEKQFKSALLKVAEAVGAVLEEGFFKETLSHTVHQHPAEFYQKCLEGSRLPTSLWANGIAGRTMDMLRRTGRVWDPKFYGRGIRLLLFQYYLGMPMDPDDLRRLNAHLDSIMKKIGGRDDPPNPTRREFSSPPGNEPMDGVISDSVRLRRLRCGFADIPDNVAVVRELEQLFGNRLDFIRHTAGRRRLSPEATGEGDAALMILDYGALAVAMRAPSYVYLFPHYELGRYPTRLSGGKTSSEIYAAQRDAVLSRLFVNVQYDHDQMCLVGEQIGRLHVAWRGG